MCLRWTETNSLWDPPGPAARPLLFIPPEWRVKREDGGDHEEDTGLASESIRRL